MDEIKTIFDESNTTSALQQQEEIKCFINELEVFKLRDDSVLCDDKKAILYYIAGYISKSLSKQACIQCNELLSPGKVPINVSFDDIDQNVDKSSMQAAISRGGFTKPSDYIYVCSIHSSALRSFIFSLEDLKKSLFSKENSRDTVHSFMHIIESDENSSQLAEVQCTSGHKHYKFLSRVAFMIFNISAKNYVLSLNDCIRKSKVSKQKLCIVIE